MKKITHKKSRRLSSIYVLKSSFCIFLFLLLNVSSSQGEITAPKNETDIPNLSQIKSRIREYHNSGKWDRDIEEQVTKAMQYIERFHTDGKKPSIVLDIDETALSNYQGIAELDFAFDFSIPQLVAWFISGKAPAIQATLKLYRKAKERGFSVFFITGRDEKYRSITEMNLRNAGYNSYDGLYMVPNENKDESVIPFKSGMRKKLVENGYTIVVNVGDQDSDLSGGFAEHHIKLPNPMYFTP